MPQKLTRRLIRTSNNRIVLHKNEKLQNISTPSSKHDTQKECKKLVVKMKRLDLKQIDSSKKDKVQNLCTLNETISKPNTRKNKISYKPNEYKPKCKCACAVALQDQCTPNISNNPGANTQVKSTKKLFVRLKRIKVDKTKTQLANTKLKSDKGKKLMVKVKRIYNNTIAKDSRKEKKVGDNVAQPFEISRFSPMRNSTVFQMGDETFSEVIDDDESKNLTNENVNGKEGLRNSVSIENRSRRCLTNKQDLIEQLICTEEDDEEEQDSRVRKDVCKTQNKGIVNRSNTHKFFHREPVNKLQPRRVSIFEFLSQSDNSDSENTEHNDPASDIINKLISEGRVRVATNHKGTGRPILKRVRKKPVNKNKILKTNYNKKSIGSANDKLNAIKEINENPNTGKPLAPEPVQHIDYEDDDTNTHFDGPDNEHLYDGGFSLLARSVLLQQTKKNEITRKKDAVEQRRLLEAALKFVSTPAANRKNESVPDLSPIQTLNTQRRPTCPSPWRINEDLHLPRVFNFTKNTSYLPSFSSDYIPPSPKKMKTHNNTHIFIDTNVPAVATASKNETIRESSGSSNDSIKNTNANNSNVENMPPPTLNVSNKDENAEIFNMRQLPNPRRTLAHRSPLKVINILEVVSLPPWKSPVNNDLEINKAAKRAYCTNNKDDETHNVDDMFGFEELIDQDSSEIDETINPGNVTANAQAIKRNLHRKLKNLKKWRPKNVVYNKSNVPVKPSRLFDEDEGAPRQRLIKEMLCSTMINQENAVHEGHEQDGNLENNTLFNAKENNAQPIEADFFNDYEPDTTMNEKQPRRTYARPVKKRREVRKLRFLDSGESSSDSDEEQIKLRKEEQKKKRHETHTKAKDNRELESFVKDFNSMCKEVENYELIVE